MGCICSCLCLEDLEEYIHSDASMNRHSSCFRFLAQQLIHLYTALFQREEVQSIPLVEQGMDSAASTVDNSVHDTHHFPSRPQPDDDPRSSRMECDGLISRRDNINHLHKESEPLRGSNNDASMELSTTIKCSGSNYEVASKLCCSKSDALAKVRYGVRHSFLPYEDEDEDMCPTCLEEYTPENPRIVTKCFHHFHLGCIYEWKERSELCPVCGKVMVFDEI